MAISSIQRKSLSLPYLVEGDVTGLACVGAQVNGHQCPVVGVRVVGDNRREVGNGIARGGNADIVCLRITGIAHHPIAHGSRDGDLGRDEPVVGI